MPAPVPVIVPSQVTVALLPVTLRGAPAPAGYDVFDGVAAHAGRHVCVLLPFEAALKALEGTEP